MKILIAMDGFFPGEKYGGPPVSVNNFCSLMDEFECYIITRNHDMDEPKIYQGIHEGWNYRKNCKVLYLSDVEYGYKSFLEIIDDLKPNIIYLQGLFQKSVFSCLKIAKKNHIKIILAPRGELCSGALSIRKYKKIPYIWILSKLSFFQNVHFHSTSDEETQAIRKYIKASAHRIHYLTNIPSIPIGKISFKEKKKGYAKFVFLSRVHPKKNLFGSIQSLEKITGNIIFDIYGPIEDEHYWNKCKSLINKLPKNIIVTYCGLIRHEMVHKVFSQYDAFLFLTFSENFGHVIAEALLSGCPIIISNNTPWTSVNNASCGWAIDIHDKQQINNAITSIVDSNDDEQLQRRLKSINFVQEKIQLRKVKKNYSKVFKTLSN